MFVRISAQPLHIARRPSQDRIQADLNTAADGLVGTGNELATTFGSVTFGHNRYL
jgi:hypothetical protein